LKTSIDEIPFVVLDVETTGFFPHIGDRMTEIAVMKIKGGKEKERFHTLINPLREIPANITEITGISSSMVSDAPEFTEIAGRLCNIFKDSVIVCHNAAFDLRFIVPPMSNICGRLDNPVVDTLLLARKQFEFPNNSLSNISRYLGFSTENAHRAMGDVEMTSSVLNYFLDSLKKNKNVCSVEDLLELQGGSIQVPYAEEGSISPVLKKAIKNSRNIKIKYISKYGFESVREVEPIEITSYKKLNYLVSFCFKASSIRVFRIDRIKDIREI